jgi:hypothetical protein
MENNHMWSVLKQSFEEGSIISVYSNKYEPEKSSVGFINYLSTEQFVMKHVTPEGINDGYIIRRVKDIFMVETSGEYEQRLKLLYTLQQQQHNDLIKKTITEKSNLFKESLLTAQEKNLIVSICIDETEDQDEIVGFVKNIHSKEATISRISFYGLVDGESTFFLEDIVKINCDTTDEKILNLLYQHKKQKSS